MKYRVEQQADSVYIPQVQLDGNRNWYIIEKVGIVCYNDTPDNRKFCTCSTLEKAKRAIFNFDKRPKFQNEMYPVYHTGILWIE